MKQKITAAYWGMLMGISIGATAIAIVLGKPLWVIAFNCGLVGITALVTVVYCMER